MSRLSHSHRRAALAACLAVLVLLPACPPGTDGEPTPPPTERPPPAGTLRLGYPEEPVSLNPIRADSAPPRDILRAVLPSFFLVTPTLEYRPYLLDAEPQVTVSGNRMTVAFRIRDDARWSDGVPVTVEDVAFTWKVMTDTELPVAVRDGFERLVEVRETTPKEGVLVLSPPFSGWRDLFSAGRFVLPAHVGKPEKVAGWQKGPPVSGGPFEIGRWVRGRSVMLDANPGFFGPRPLVQRIEVAFVPDPTTAIQLLGAGRLDAVAPMLGFSWGRRMASVPGVSISQAYGPTLVHLAMNADALGLRLRRRIADAVDRGRFVETVLRGEGRQADGVLVPEQQGAVPGWGTLGSGRPQRIGVDRELRLVYPRGETMELLARYMRAELGRAGADVELLGLDATVFRTDWLPQVRFDLALWEVRGGPGPWLARWFGSNGGEAVTGLEDGRLDALLAELDEGASVDETAVREAQERLARLVPVLPVFQPEVTTGWGAGVTGLRANPTADGPLWNAWAWSKVVREEAEAAAA